MVQIFIPERLFCNSLEQCLIPVDPNKPNYNDQTDCECEDECVANIQELISQYTHDTITDEDLKVKIHDKNPDVSKFSTELIADLNIVFA